MTDAPGESRTDKPIIHRQKWDIAVWLLFVLFNIFWCGYGLYPVLFGIGFAILLFLLIAERRHVLHRVQKITRGILYVGAVLFTILPYTMQIDAPWYYPVQRALFLSGYDKSATLYQMLPQTLPTDAADYDASFVPALPQGGAVVRISFYSDAESLAAYRRQAEQCGAAHCDITDNDPYAEKWLSIRTDEGVNMQGAEVYIFLSGYHSAYYIINESTGYFELYYC